ncbi:MAG: DHH family phosphoesterase, partial [Candidatus Pacearchaeota archaeon]
MIESLRKFTTEFLSKAINKEVQIISHYDTDGITSAAIIITALQRKNIRFSLKIVKQLDEDTIKLLDQNKILLFLDLASNSFDYLKKLKSEIFILDHHEIMLKIPENVRIINPHLFNEEEISGSGLAYLFAKQIDEKNKDLAYLAVIGMIGDSLEKNIT